MGTDVSMEYAGTTRWYPYMKISADTRIGEDVIYDSEILKRVASGDLLFFSRAEPGSLVEIREGSFVINGQCMCVHPKSGEVGMHRQYWAVLKIEGKDWLCRRTA